MRNTYLKVYYAVLEDSRLTLSDAIIFSAMLDRSVNHRITIKVSELANLTGIAQRTAELAIRHLKETGYIVDSEKAGTRVATYTLAFLPEDNLSDGLAQKILKDLQMLCYPTLTVFQTELIWNELCVKIGNDGTLEFKEKKFKELYLSLFLLKEFPENPAAYIMAKIKNSKNSEFSFDVDKYKCFINDFDDLK